MNIVIYKKLFISKEFLQMWYLSRMSGITEEDIHTETFGKLYLKHFSQAVLPREKFTHFGIETWHETKSTKCGISNSF